jgi:hypothetical protein
MSLLPLIASAVKQYEVSQTIKTSLTDAERELHLSAQRRTPPRWDKEQRLTQIEQEQSEISALEEAEKRRSAAAATTLKRA